MNHRLFLQRPGAAIARSGAPLGALLAFARLAFVPLALVASCVAAGWLSARLERYPQVLTASAAMQYWRSADLAAPTAGSLVEGDVAQAGGCASTAWHAMLVKLPWWRLGPLAEPIVACLAQRQAADMVLPAGRLGGVCQAQLAAGRAMLASLPVVPATLPPNQRAAAAAQRSALEHGLAKLGDCQQLRMPQLLALYGWTLRPIIDRQYGVGPALVADADSVAAVLQRARGVRAKAAWMPQVAAQLRMALLAQGVLVLLVCAWCAPAYLGHCALLLVGMVFGLLGGMEFNLTQPALRYGLLANLAPLTVAGQLLVLWPPALVLALAMVGGRWLCRVPATALLHRPRPAWLVAGPLLAALLVAALLLGGSLAVAIGLAVGCVVGGALLGRVLWLRQFAGVSRLVDVLAYGGAGALGIGFFLLRGDLGHLLIFAATYAVGAWLLATPAKLPLAAPPRTGAPWHRLCGALLLAAIVTGLALPSAPGVRHFYRWLGSYTVEVRNEGKTDAASAAVADFAINDSWLDVSMQAFPAFEIPFAGIDGRGALTVPSSADYFLCIAAPMLSTDGAIALVFAWLVLLLTPALHAWPALQERATPAAPRVLAAIVWLGSIGLGARLIFSTMGVARLWLLSGVASPGLSHGVVASCEAALYLGLGFAVLSNTTSR